ncbi:MAG: hypothetical protein B6I17_00385 [Tenericutes bacterium 4572_104]|nr:MAG: hypothetical protein B6I17_00385 [Tenericutes bacterium 4572_104]
MKKIKNIIELKEIIDKSQSIVLVNKTKLGLSNLHMIEEEYNQANKTSLKKFLSKQFFYNQPKIFFENYKKYIFGNNFLFNFDYLKKLEKQGKLKNIIDLNIDGIFTLKGFNNVIQLYGDIHKNYCIKCHKEFSLNYIKEYIGTVRCDLCNGLVKPNVTLPNEIILKSLLEKALFAIEKADLLLMLETPINNYPISNFIISSKKTLLITDKRTSKDIYLDYIYYADVLETLAKLNKKEVRK